MSDRRPSIRTNNNDQYETGLSRLSNSNLRKAVLGGLAYLNDTHVYDASNFSGAFHDFFLFNNGKMMLASRILTSLRIFLGRYIIRERHIEGAWPSYVHNAPEFTNPFLKPFSIVTDYNLFTIASTAYSLFLFDDSNLPEEFRSVKAMLNNAIGAISKYKRGNAYNFWLPFVDLKRDYIFTRPINLPISLINLRYRIYKLTGMLGLKKFNGSEAISNWVENCYNTKKNPWGGPALFNLPNDADNTSVAIATQVIYNKLHANNHNQEDLTPLGLLELFRDCNRSKYDYNNQPDEKDTGAYMTWFKDEELPVFSFPENGVIPLYINNVDITINANVLFALALTNKQSTPGFQETVKYIIRSIDQSNWYNKSIYYPQKLVFAYSISRAWRDGMIKDQLLEDSLAELMGQILEEQFNFEKTYPDLSGAFPDDSSRSLHHSTGLGLVTLLNLGREIAEKHGFLERYIQVVDNAVLFLVNSRKSIRARQESTRKNFPDIMPTFWSSGVLYASSKDQFAQWYSHAQTTSLIVEGLAKYILAYDIKKTDAVAGRLILNLTENKLSLSLNPCLLSKGL